MLKYSDVSPIFSARSPNRMVAENRFELEPSKDMEIFNLKLFNFEMKMDNIDTKLQVSFYLDVI